MRTLGTLIAVLLALLWSGVVWGGYGLLLWSSDFVAASGDIADFSPDASAWAGLLSDLLRDYGTAAAAAIWAIGLMAILLLRALFNWLVGLGAGSRTPEATPASQRPRDPVSVPPVPAPAPRAEPVPPIAAPQRWGRGASPR